MAEPDRNAILAELFDRAWEPHGWTPDHHFEMGLSQDALSFLSERVQPGDRTLETGTGYSTVVFALNGAKHTAVSPVSWEHERITGFCEERGLSLANVNFVEALSQDALPNLPKDPLDFVLIDGDHSFPTPFVDFYFAASLLRPGGVLIVDDTHIRTGDILRRFLASEEGRWHLERQFPTTAAFVKLTDTLIDMGGWQTQPFCAETVPPWGTPAVQRLRWRLKLRTRLRELGRKAHQDPNVM